MLLVAAAVVGEPMGWAAEARASGGVGGGLMGLTDPEDVGANGRPGTDDELDLDELDTDGPGLPNGPLGIPGVMLDAYMQAEKTVNASLPACHIHWSLLASIGRIESNHARGGRVDADGNTTPHILGPVLNGGGFAAIKDTDNGRYDGDSGWDRAVGSMQFIPSTWSGYASDGNADGKSDPHNVYDATVAAGKYLCSGGMDLANHDDRARAVFRYNHSESYVRTVLMWADAYAKGVTPLPSGPYDDYPGGDYPGTGGDYPDQALPGPQTPDLPPPTSGPPPGTPPVTTTTWTSPSKTTPPCGPQPSPTDPTTTTPTSPTTTTPTSTPPSSTTTTPTTTTPTTTTPTC